MPCRAAHATYIHERAANPQVPAREAAAHLRNYKRLGVRELARITGVSPTLVYGLLLGTQRTLRQSLSTRILATPLAGHTTPLVPVWRTQKLLDALESEGFTRAQIAQLIHTGPTGLRCDSDYVRRRTAQAIERLYVRIVVEDRYEVALPVRTT